MEDREKKDPQLAVDVGKRIKELRESREMTQEELAAEIDVSPRHISKVENGKGRFSYENVIAASRYFGVSCDYILCGSELGLPDPVLIEQTRSLRKDEIVYVQNAVINMLKALRRNE